MRSSGNPPRPSFREYANLPGRDYDYEPLRLWLLLVLLRSRRDYYEEAILSTRLHIERLWKQAGVGWSWEEFERSHTVEMIWEHSAPPWWEINDIVGFIDIRFDVNNSEIGVALFLPRKRISRQLRDKTYYFRRREVVQVPEIPKNEQLRQAIVEKVREVRRDERLQRLYVDLPRWEILVEFTDLAGIIERNRQAMNVDDSRETF